MLYSFCCLLFCSFPLVFTDFTATLSSDFVMLARYLLSSFLHVP
jgi:hypothetical protein